VNGENVGWMKCDPERPLGYSDYSG